MAIGGFGTFLKFTLLWCTENRNPPNSFLEQPALKERGEMNHKNLFLVKVTVSRIDLPAYFRQGVEMRSAKMEYVPA